MTTATKTTEEQRIQDLEEEGCTRSDAQGIVEAEDMTRQSIITRMAKGDWIVSGTGGRLWWCSNETPGSLVRRLTSSEEDALQALLENRDVEKETKTYQLGS